MRKTALFLALLLAACGRAPAAGPLTDISGSTPRLEFHLTRASDGTAATAADYRGKVVALYFGYSHCPDICPTTLANLTDMLGRVKSPNVEVLFVSVDPDRDTLPVLRQYASAFSPQMEGLRDSADALADTARRYRIAYSVDKAPPYTVMHSNAVFFFDAQGKARYVTLDTTDVGAMTEAVKQMLATS